MDVMDVLGPVLLCIVVIAAVAAVYFGVTALRDRSREKRGPQSASHGSDTHRPTRF